MFKSGYQTNIGKVPMEPTWSWFGAFYKELVGTCDLRTLGSPLVSLNHIYFKEALCFK